MPPNISDAYVMLKPVSEWPEPRKTRDELAALVKAEVEKMPGQNYEFSQPIQLRFNELISGVRSGVAVKIFGDDNNVLSETAKKVSAVLQGIPGAQEVKVEQTTGLPMLTVNIDRQKAARYGLNTGDVNTVVQAALSGSQATTILEGDRQFALTVRLAPEYRATIDAVRNIRVAYSNANGGNAYIPLSALADITLDTGASYIYHEKNARYIPVKFSVRGRDLGGTVEEAQQRIAQHVKLPQGYRIEWAGEFEELEQAKQRLAVMVPISILLILVLLYGLFNSLRDSLMALAGIPFAITGGVAALFLTGLDFSVSAAIGFVSLFGVSVMDGILMITYYNDLRRERGLQPTEAMFHAAQQRMRPMLMTALSACIGLFPAAISTGIGSQVQRPLATVVVGGMLVGPLMLLVIVPALRMVFLGKEPESDDPSTGDTAPV